MAFNLIEWLQMLIDTFGLPAIFLGSVISSATIVVPLPFDFLVLAASTTYNPVLLVIATALGSAIGEISAYIVGLGGRKAIGHIRDDDPKQLRWVDKKFHKYGFKAIVLFALTPLPLDIIGLLAGAARYDMKKFFIGTLIGKTGKYAIIVAAGYFGLPFLAQIFLNGST